MSETVMPCFVQFPECGNLVGRLLAGYGELEVEMCLCLSEVMDGNFDGAMKILFVRMSAEDRQKLAKRTMSAPFSCAGLSTEFEETMVAMNWCRKIRNQYAHSQWYFTTEGGIAIINLEEIVQKAENVGPIASYRRPIDRILLAQQDAYFLYTKRLFLHLSDAYRRIRSADSLTKRQKALPLTFPLPPKAKRPKLHL